MRHNGVTLVELIVAAAIAGTLIGLLMPVVGRLWVAKAEAGPAGEPQDSWSLCTVKHDKHWWILGNHVGFHHPDCPCRAQQRAEVDE